MQISLHFHIKRLRQKWPLKEPVSFQELTGNSHTEMAPVSRCHSVRRTVFSGKDLLAPSMLSGQDSYKHRAAHRTGPFVQTIATRLLFADGR
jgi:hypothetical protein